MPGSALAGMAVVRVVYTHASASEFINTLHVRQGASGANTVAGLTGLANAVATEVSGADFKALLSTVTLIKEVQVEDISPTHFATVIVPIGLAGTDAGQPAAIESSLVVTLGTGLAGRAFRGRWYAGGLVASRLNGNGNFWDSDWALAWQEALEDLYSAIASASPVNYAPVLYHRLAGIGGVPAADTVTPLTTATGRIELATQRRRRPQIGS